MSWRQITLAKGQIDSGYHTRLHDDFRVCLEKHKFERGVAVFVDAAGSGQKMKFYFPPVLDTMCSALLLSYQAVPCEKPKLGNIKQVLGQKGATWEYFKNEDK